LFPLSTGLILDEQIATPRWIVSGKRLLDNYG